MKDKKIRICFLILGAYPLFNEQIGKFDIKGGFGGAEIDLYTIAWELAKCDQYEVSFWVGDFGQKDEEVYGSITVRKFKYFEGEKTDTKLNKIYRKIMLVKQLYAMNADIFITETASSIVGLLSIFEKVIKRKKCIFRLASDVNADINFYKKDKNTYWLYKFGLTHQSLIISQTEKQKELLKQNLNLDSIVIRNAFLIRNNTDSTRKKYILWVARGVALKRPELFAMLARKLPDEKFLIIMPGNNSICRNVATDISRLDNIEFIDFVPFFNIQKFYDEAKLFVNTSLYEGFPNSFIQACLGKTPILSFRVNPDNIISDYDLGYMCNDSIDEAVSFIHNLEDEKITYYGENAFNYVLQNHNIAVIINQYHKVIQDLMRKGKVRSIWS